MAESSYRFNPVFQAGRYWRLDISWRTNATDDRHFIGEWNGAGIPEQPAGEYLQFTVPRFKIMPRDENDLLAVDRLELKVKMNSIVESFVNPSNVSAELRLWVTRTPDEPGSWTPRFWGVVDLDDIDPETMAIVDGVWIKTVSITAYDGIETLARTEFNDQTLMDKTAYHISAGLDAYLGPHMMTMVLGRYHEMTWNVTPKMNGQSQVIHCKYYLEQLANICFPERAEASSLPLAQYGPDKDAPTSGPFRFQAFTHYENWPASPYIERDFHHLWFWYDMFSAEWKDEFTSWGEFLSELTEMLGFVVTTRHYIDAGRWVRVLCYLRVDGDNGRTVKPTGVLLRKTGPRARRASRKVVVTTRTPSGAEMPIFDAYWGKGPERKMTTHWRTIGFLGAVWRYDGLDYGDVNDKWTMNDFTGWQKENILWGTMLITNTGNQLQLVNRVRWGSYLMPSDVLLGFGLWDETSLRSFQAIQPNIDGFHGLSGLLAIFYAEAVHSPGRAICEDTYSRLEGDDDVSQEIDHWLPYLTTVDEEHPAYVYKITGIEMDTEKGHIKVRKEEIPLPNPFI